MQHETHRVPVTAVAFFRDGIVLAGEGNYLSIYSADHRRLKSVRIFESQAVHGITIDNGSATTVLAWGGPLVRRLCLDLNGDGNSDISFGGVHNVGDWILDAAFAPPSEGDMRRAALVTAHNALLVADIDSSLFSSKSPNSRSINRLTPGSNCILYSAHVKWLSLSSCLIACGTAFGDIIVWSASTTASDGKLSARTQTHYTFSAHEGSVFGVQISPLVRMPNSKSKRRLLASCSDDRNIKVWDISDMITQEDSATVAYVKRPTGFGSVPDNMSAAPECLAQTMGHTSRIWHVRFEAEPLSNLRRILSFGEDASVISWNVRPDVDGHYRPYTLEKTDVTVAHGGKNIWSVAHNEAAHLATGGADGAIALHLGMRDSDGIFEIACHALEGSWSGDNFKAYAFVDDCVLVSTTDHGRVVLVDISRSDEKVVTKQIAEPLSGLHGYSIIASVPGISFLGGTDGCIFSCSPQSQRLSKIANVDGKVAGIFACQHSTIGVAVLVTSVGATTAKLLLLDHHHETEFSTVTEVSKLGLPSGFIVTTFTLHECEFNVTVVLGSRHGSIALFNGLATTSSDPTLPIKVYELAHGKEAVTSLYWTNNDSTSNEIGWICSTGRDGTFAVHRVTISDVESELHQVHQLQLSFGPNVEGIGVSPGGKLQVWGFKSKLFVVYDILEQKEIMAVECGGAHRNWAFQPNDNGGTFTWTKASNVYRKTQTKLPYELINSGGHGREIKAVVVSQGSTGSQVVATGAEDTNIKLFRLEKGNFKLLQTLRKHNTGIQCLKWSADFCYLFSSGGFEEFFVWRVSAGIPYIDLGVLCESTHPRSGNSDLRIMGFDISEGMNVGPVHFTITMAYSDSTVRLWRYANEAWDLLASGDYLTACLMHALHANTDGSALMTAATDGHLARWQSSPYDESLQWSGRYKVHQSAIHVTCTHELSDGSILVATGGDDNAIGLTRMHSGPQATAMTLLIARAHAAAVTGLALMVVDEGTYWLASAGIDQRVKLWQVNVDASIPGVDSIAVKRLQNVYTAVADVSSLDICRLEDGGTGLLVCGVGMDLWRLPSKNDMAIKEDG